MMRAVHQRLTHGKIVPSRLLLPWLTTQPKIYGAEPLKCIPAGIYTCVPYFSPKRQEDCWLLENVPGFTGIEIHVGNYACEVAGHKPDTIGCLMYGFSYDPSVPMLLDSKKAIDYLHVTIGLKSTWQLQVLD